MEINGKVICPQCCGDRHCSLQKDGRYKCRLCGYVFSAEDKSKETGDSLRVFISYKHDYETVVKRIEKELRNRGHIVWFDQHDIHEGNDWREAIRRGIASSNGVLAFLSRNSLQRGGVCLDELGIAVGVKYGNIITALLQKEEELQPIPSFLTHRQWIDLHEWQEKLDAKVTPDEEWIQEQIGKVTEVVESRETREFAGDITNIRMRLNIQDTVVSKQGKYLAQLYIGREWLVKEIEEWLDQDDGGRLCVVYGGPGTGKSAFAAQYAYLNRRVAASFYFEYENPYFNSVRSMICELSLQLACRLPLFRLNLMDSLSRMDDCESMSDDSLFEAVLKSPIARCQIDGGHERLCIVIDGLDECQDQQGAVSRMINEYCSRMPDWIRVLVLSREESQITQFLKPNKVIRVTERREEQIRDIRSYYQERLGSLLEKEPQRLLYLDRLTEKAAGVFLYADIVSGMILDGRMRLQDTDSYPENLNASFQGWFTRYFPDMDEFNRNYRLILGIIAACDEPIPESELASLNNWELEYDEKSHRYSVRAPESLFSHKEDIEILLQRIAPLLKRDEAGLFGRAISFRHRYIVEWYSGNQAGKYYCSQRDAFLALTEVWYESLRSGYDISPFRCVKYLPYAQTALKGQANMLRRLASVENLESAIRGYIDQTACPLKLTQENLSLVRHNEILREKYESILKMQKRVIYGENSPEAREAQAEISAKENEIALAQIRSLLCLPGKCLENNHALVSHLSGRSDRLSPPERLAMLAAAGNAEFSKRFAGYHPQINAAAAAQVMLPGKCVYFFQAMDINGKYGPAEPFLEIPCDGGNGEITLLWLMSGDQPFCLDLTELWPGGTLEKIPDGFAVENKQINGVRLPDGLQTIGKAAFFHCASISGELILPDSLRRIGANAFEYCCGLSGELKLPDSVRIIERKTFCQCTGFTGLRLSRSLTEIGESAFENCQGFTGGLFLPDSLMAIGKKAFLECKGFNKELRFPDHLTELGERAFEKCSGFTGGLNLPDTLAAVPYAAFDGCKGLDGKLHLPSSLSSIGQDAFRDCCNLTGEPELPDTLLTIGFSAFSHCKGLSGRLKLPESLKTIGPYAFDHCAGFTGELRIPDSVSDLGHGAFRCCSGLNGGLHLPDRITEIRRDTFYNCFALSGELCLPETVVLIGEDAFSGCRNLTGELRLPASIGSIGVQAFYGCRGLNGSLYLPDRITSVGRAAFMDCGGFDGILRLPEELVSVPDEAFYGCNGLTGELVIPDSVRKIGKEAFYGCRSLTGGLRFPVSMEAIGDRAFYGCAGLNGELILEETVSVGDHAFTGTDLKGKKETEIRDLAGLTEIPDHSIVYCDGINGLTVCPGIEKIGAGVLWFCEQEISGPLCLPDGLIEIGRDAFKNMNGLTGELRLPESLKMIGSGAFSGCTGLTGTLRLPGSLDAVGSVEEHQPVLNYMNLNHPYHSNGVFAGCGGFTGDLIIPDAIARIGAGCFSGCYGFDGILKLPAALKTIGKMAFWGCCFTGELRLPKELTDIGERAFDSCHGFTGSLRLPDSISSIGKGAFSECDGFCGELILPDTLNEIKAGTFEKCSSLTGRLHLPQDLTAVGENAFCDCAGFSGDLILPDSVTAIGSRAFKRCKGFNGKLTLPGKLKKINAETFQECSSLTGTLALPDTITSVGDHAFEGCSSLTGELVLPDSLTSAGEYAFAGCSGLNGDLVLPESMTSVGNCAFYGCSGLNGELHLSESLQIIGYYAFASCGLSGKLYLPESIRAVGAAAFWECHFEQITVMNPQMSFYNACIMPFSGTLIRGWSGSTAEKYAALCGLPFEPLEEQKE